MPRGSCSPSPPRERCWGRLSCPPQGCSRWGRTATGGRAGGRRRGGLRGTHPGARSRGGSLPGGGAVVAGAPEQVLLACGPGKGALSFDLKTGQRARAGAPSQGACTRGSPGWRSTSRAVTDFRARLRLLSELITECARRQFHWAAGRFCNRMRLSSEPLTSAAPPGVDKVPDSLEVDF